MRQSVSRFTPPLALLAVVFSLGCPATLPNMTPFVDQTSRMSSGVQNGYTRAQTLLSQADLQNDVVRRLDTVWKENRKTLNALEAYSQALADLAEAGGQGTEAAGRVFEALDGLAGTIVPGTAIPDNIAGAVSALNGYIARVRARTKLKEILEVAQPAVDTIASLIRQNLEALEQVNELAAGQVKRDHFEDNQVIVNYFEGLVREDGRILRVMTIMLEREAALDANRPAIADARLTDLRNEDPVVADLVTQLQADHPDTWEDHLEQALEQRQDLLRGRSRAIQSEADRYRSTYEAYVARQAEIDKLRISGSEILRKSAAAVRAWARAHGNLLKSLEEESTFVNLVGFARAVQDVYDAYTRE